MYLILALYSLNSLKRNLPDNHDILLADLHIIMPVNLLNRQINPVSVIIVIILCSAIADCYV